MVTPSESGKKFFGKFEGTYKGVFFDKKRYHILDLFLKLNISNLLLMNDQYWSILRSANQSEIMSKKYK